LKGGVVFHTAVSPAGVGPTSSNKLEIEGSFETLSKKGGIKMHLGKGAIKPETVEMLAENNAVFAIIPPVTALLESQTLERECVAWSELGMEALYRIKVENYQAIIAAAKGRSIYDK
jgi:fumarate hydratase subunit beta